MTEMKRKGAEEVRPLVLGIDRWVEAFHVRKEDSDRLVNICMLLSTTLSEHL